MIFSAKEYLLIAVLFLFFVTAISWIFFGRFTMAKIEKRIRNDGLVKQFKWDGVGMRIVLYAYAIVLPKSLSHRLEKNLINSSLIRKYASDYDKLSGLSFLISSNLLVITCIFGWLIWG